MEEKLSTFETKIILLERSIVNLVIKLATLACMENPGNDSIDNETDAADGFTFGQFDGNVTAENEYDVSSGENNIDKENKEDDDDVQSESSETEYEDCGDEFNESTDALEISIASYVEDPVSDENSEESSDTRDSSEDSDSEDHVSSQSERSSSSRKESRSVYETAKDEEVASVAEGNGIEDDSSDNVVESEDSDVEREDDYDYDYITDNIERAIEKRQAKSQKQKLSMYEWKGLKTSEISMYEWKRLKSSEVSMYVYRLKWAKSWKMIGKWIKNQWGLSYLVDRLVKNREEILMEKAKNLAENQ